MTKQRAVAKVTVEFAGAFVRVEPPGPFVIGREGDLSLGANEFLHRRFLQIVDTDGLWWLINIGSRIVATVTDGAGGVRAQLAPGGRLPLVFDRTIIVFSAGALHYEIVVHSPIPAFSTVQTESEPTGESTIGEVPLTESQKQLIVALAEPVLRREGAGLSEIPTSADAAARLGWTMTRFNRKLDNVCDKFDRIGVAGLRGGPGSGAVNRRVRLVEHAVGSGLVNRDDLALLDKTDTPENGPR